MATEEQKQIVLDMFNSVGKTILIEEAYIDAVGAVSGSGPAYMYQILEALADGAVLIGLPRATAYQLAAQTMAGSAMMLLETGEHPGVLKDQVTSPGGTTIRALKVMEEKGVRSAMIEAVRKHIFVQRSLVKKNDLFIFADSGRRIEFSDSYTLSTIFCTTQSIQFDFAVCV